MKVLVTGGAGFIATNFMYYMVNKYPEYNFVNLDALTYAGNYNNIKDLEGKPNYKFVKGDITDREFIDKLFEEEKFDWVVNFAAESHVDNSIKNPGIFLTTNILGTQVLMDASRKYGQTIIMITHNRSIAQTADRVLQVSDGNLTDFGRCRE